MQIPKAPIAKGSFGLLVLGGTRATDKGHEFLDQAPGEGHESHEFLDQAPDEGHEFLDQAPDEGLGRGRHGRGPRSSAAERATSSFTDEGATAEAHELLHGRGPRGEE